MLLWNLNITLHFMWLPLYVKINSLRHGSCLLFVKCVCSRSCCLNSHVWWCKKWINKWPAAWKFVKLLIIWQCNFSYRESIIFLMSHQQPTWNVYLFLVRSIFWKTIFAVLRGENKWPFSAGRKTTNIVGVLFNIRGHHYGAGIVRQVSSGKMSAPESRRSTLVTWWATAISGNRVARHI